MSETLPAGAGALALCVLRKNAAAFAEHAPQSHAGSDPEHVHQSRVATRRMRAALRVFEDVVPTDVRDLDSELKWITGQLGPVRDIDVQVSRVQVASAELDLARSIGPYCAWLEEQRDRAFTSLDDALRSQRFSELAQRLQYLDKMEPDLEHNPPVEQDAPLRLKSAYRKLRKVARDLDADSPATAFHKARIRGKRFRYTVEFLEDVYGKPARRLIKDTVAMQDVLGDHQDGVVSSVRIHEALHTIGGSWPADTLFALGRLIQWEAQRAERLRREFGVTYLEVQEGWQRLRQAL